MLFATLDPTLRRLHLANGRSAILSDTVGFISDLPHELVDAFRATLDEVREADVIVHVRDIATQDSEAQSQDVTAVLDELGVKEEGGRKILEVWNKSDLLTAESREDLTERASRTGAVLVSAVDGGGFSELALRIAALIDDDPERTFQLDPGDGEALAWLYRHGRVTGQTGGEVADGEGSDGRLTVTARLSPRALGRFEVLRPGSASA
jgi:GTP-binding protein HflX